MRFLNLIFGALLDHLDHKGAFSPCVKPGFTHLGKYGFGGQ